MLGYEQVTHFGNLDSQSLNSRVSLELTNKLIDIAD